MQFNKYWDNMIIFPGICNKPDCRVLDPLEFVDLFIREAI